MKIISGKYNSAKVFTDWIDDTCTGQIQGLLDQEAFHLLLLRSIPYSRALRARSLRRRASDAVHAFRC